MYEVSITRHPISSDAFLLKTKYDESDPKWFSRKFGHLATFREEHYGWVIRADRLSEFQAEADGDPEVWVVDDRTPSGGRKATGKKRELPECSSCGQPYAHPDSPTYRGHPKRCVSCGETLVLRNPSDIQHVELITKAICAECGHEQRGRFEFCGECGARMVYGLGRMKTVCRNCGQRGDEGLAYCTNCEHPLSRDEAEADRGGEAVQLGEAVGEIVQMLGGIPDHVLHPPTPKAPRKVGFMRGKPVVDVDLPDEESKEEEQDDRQTWVCDGCMSTIHHDQIAIFADGEHVICKTCDRRETEGDDDPWRL